MPYNPDIHHRRSVRLREYNYAQAGLYFITLCVQNHRCVFGDIVNSRMILNEYGKTAYNCWLEIPQHYQYIVLHEFVIMPNHIHGILEIADVGVEYFRPNNETDNKRVENIRPLQRPNCKSGTIGAIVRGFKIGVTKQIDHSVWQRNYHEHIIRNRDRHAMIVDYINHNPAQWEHDRFYAN